MLGQHPRHLAQQIVADGQDHGTASLELHLLQDHDLTLRDPHGLGATVLLRIGVGRALLVGAGVYVVADTVAVGVGRAAVFARIGARHALDVGTRIVLVRNAVAIAVGRRRRAPVFRGIVAGHARLVGAGVVPVWDAVVIAIGGLLGLPGRRRRRRRRGRLGRVGQGEQDTQRGRPHPAGEPRSCPRPQHKICQPRSQPENSL